MALSGGHVPALLSWVSVLCCPQPLGWVLPVWRERMLLHLGPMAAHPIEQQSWG